MTTDTRDWLEARSWRALDVDDDGRVLATHDETGTMQLVELDGDRSTPLTDLPGAVSGRYLRLSGGGRAVVVQHDSGGDENSQLSLLRLDPLPPAPAGLADLEPLAHDATAQHALLDIAPDRVVFTTNRRNHVDFDVVSLRLSTGEETVLYDGGGNVTGAAVSPDGRRVAAGVVAPYPLATRLLLAGDGPAADLTPPDEGFRHERVAWTSDGAALLVSSDAGRDTLAVVRVDPGSGERTVLVSGVPADRDDDCVSPDGCWDTHCWPSPDGDLLLVEELVDGESRLALHDQTTGGLVRPLPLPHQGTAAAGCVAYHPLPEPVFSPSGAFLALSFSAPGVPGDVLLVDLRGGAGGVGVQGATVRALTSSADGLPAAPVALPSAHRVPAHDGERIPTLLYPAGTDGGAADGSAVLVVHGGPEGQSVRTFNPLVQALTAAGHAVVVPNVRGSVGYGTRWASLDDVGLRLDSVRDLASLHDWLPSQGLDAARVALWGGSYGGYMVLAGVTMQPERWAAGVDIVGISSLVSFLENTSPYRRAAREREYGRLETDREMLVEASPLTYVDAVRAPLVVIHGANDPRVPLSEADQVVAAVRERGLECLRLVYDDEGHGLAKRANRLDAYPQAVDFLARHLAGPAPS